MNRSGVRGILRGGSFDDGRVGRAAFSDGSARSGSVR